MWALRRHANPLSVKLRFRGLGIGTYHACCAKAEVSSSSGSQEEATSIFFSKSYHTGGSVRNLLHHQTLNVDSEFSMGRRGLSSQAGAESSGREDDDDLEDGFSELETASGGVPDHGNEDELISEPELSDVDNDGNEDPSALESLETDAGGKKYHKTKAYSEIFKVIISSPGDPVHVALDKWVGEGNEVSRDDCQVALFLLRKRRMYGRALQLSEWMEASKKLDFGERDYASRLDLIAKVRGLPKAQYYLENIPKSMRGEVAYRTFLANCVRASNVGKAEETFNKMKDLEFPVTSFACNQLLLLYKRLDKKKIADVLLLMEKENVKPTLFTYKLLIDTKGQSNDITGMDQIVETMKAEGVEPDFDTKAVLARHYIYGGLKEKAEALLKEMEGGNLKENRVACQFLLPLYAMLGKVDEVKRVWESFEKGPRLYECMAAIEAYGKLGKVDEAEAVFERAVTTFKKLSSRHYSALLKVYANHKMLAKGKDLVKRMGDSGCRVGPLTWDALVRLYVEAGEVEKADSILNKAAQQNQVRPLFNSFMAIMDQYAKRGDVHNAEKVFHRMRQAGYFGRHRQFQALIQAYVNAKAPAYGFRERMKADNVFPNKTLASQLGLVDAFRKTAVSDLLD
ncbi:hypothetical protein Tsubulata_003566 [Turnera subulata]|uniref:PROP1-like PPR domain-containing protein n=1 Tax=Turnera subulata TaxID=218843 RepID=A0A9Q0GB07_9ROSI|nr:hypothetical protein Tsubulata_003566 [Turnera subulata]